MEVFQKAIVKVDVASASDVLGLNVTAAGAASNSEGFGVVVEQAVNGSASMLSVAVYGGNTGPVEVKAAATIAKGDLLKVTTGGKFTPASTANKDIPNAVALEAAAADELVPAVLLPPHAWAAAAFAAHS
jgi:hypothetical protein